MKKSSNWPVIFLLSAELRKSSFYIGHDESTVFVSIEPDINKSIVENTLRFEIIVCLSFIRSYLSGNLQNILFDYIFLQFSQCWKDVERSYVLGPLFFTCYVLLLELIFETLNLRQSICFWFGAEHSAKMFSWFITTTKHKEVRIFVILSGRFNGLRFSIKNGF